jgi:hypothetical protein
VSTLTRIGGLDRKPFGQIWCRKQLQGGNMTIVGILVVIILVLLVIYLVRRA